MLRLKISDNLGIHDVISVQNMDKASNPRDDAFERHPELTEQLIIAHRDTAMHSRRYRVHLKSRWADEDKWIYPGKNFEDLPTPLCGGYDASVLHAAKAMTASFMQDYLTKPPGPGQQLGRPIL